MGLLLVADPFEFQGYAQFHWLSEQHLLLKVVGVRGIARSAFEMCLASVSVDECNAASLPLRLLY